MQREAKSTSSNFGTRARRGRYSKMVGTCWNIMYLKESVKSKGTYSVDEAWTSGPMHALGAWIQRRLWHGLQDDFKSGEPSLGFQCYVFWSRTSTTNCSKRKDILTFSVSASIDLDQHQLISGLTDWEWADWPPNRNEFGRSNSHHQQRVSTDCCGQLFEDWY